jgi:Peptidase M10 serralysin C terminal
MATNVNPTAVGLSNNTDIDGILWGWRWGAGINTSNAPLNLTYSFPTATTEYTNGGYVSITGFAAFNAAQQAAITSILNEISSFANLSFTETANAGATLRYADATAVDYTNNAAVARNNGNHTIPTAESNPPELAAGPIPPNSNAPFSAPYAQGDGWFNGYTNPQLGSFQLAAGLMHETGHNLGLKHGHVTQVGHGITFPAETANHDSLEYTIMTYRQFPGNPIQPFNNTDFPTTYMQDDIAALQYLYGAHYAPGAHTYSWSPTTGQEFIDGVGQGAPISNFVLMTVWDGGGNATYDFSNYTTNQSIDLNPGQWVVLDTSAAHLQRADLGNNASVPGSPHYFARGNIAEAQIDPNNPNEITSLIKNVILGSGTDTVIGNHANNKVDGGGGQDTFVETGNHTDHSFTLLSTGYVQIQDLRPGSPDGTDLIKSVQLVQFSDGTFKVGLLAPNFALLQQDATNFLLAENAGGNVNPVLAEAAVNGPLTQLLKDLGNNVTNLMTSTDASVPASVLANLTVPVTQILSDALFQSPNLTADNTTLIGVANLIGHGYHVV